MNCADGGVIDNLPVSIAAQQASAIIAVDVGNTDLTRGIGFAGQGFTAIYMRAASMMMHALQQVPLIHWKGPPMLLIRPRVSQIGWFSFGHTAELIEEGYHAAAAALDACPAFADAPGGVFPRRPVSIKVVRERCTSCGLCVSLAPQTMALDREGIAYALNPVVDWSPADGDFVHHCPTSAIVVAALTPRSVAAIREAEAGVPEGLAR